MNASGQLSEERLRREGLWRRLTSPDTVRPVGLRDPNWLFTAHHPLVYVGVFLYCSVQLFVDLGLNLSWVFIGMLLCLPFALLYNLNERRLDRHAPVGADEQWEGNNGFAARLIGRPAELERVFALGKRPLGEERCFRTGLRRDQVAVLLIMILVLWPAPKLVFGMTLPALPWICLGILAAMLLQIALRRTRYRVSPGAVIVEDLSWWTVVQSQKLLLSQAKFECNFTEGTMEIVFPVGVLRLCPVEMFCPHRFAAAILAGARQMGPACAAGPAR